MLVVATGLLAAAAANPGGAAATAGDSESGSVRVTVPTLRYEARNDVFRAGPYRSRLDVLFNDGGLPARDRLTLLDRRGRPASTVTVPRVGHLRVRSGYVVLDPLRGARGRVSFTYRAASPNGPVAAAGAVVDLYARVIVTRDDRARTRPGTPVVIDIAANDRLVVPGAVRACRPRLFSRPPRRPDPLPVVLPEQQRKSLVCAADDGIVTTKQGDWRLDLRGRAVFTPAAGFTGTANAYYRQASDHPFDLGVARVSVSVGRGGGAALGSRVGQGGESGGAGESHTRGGGAGPLAATGAAAVLLAALAAILAVVGLLMVIAARRRRQDQLIDLEA